MSTDEHGHHCTFCGGRGVDQSHLDRCRHLIAQRGLAKAHGEQYGIPAVTSGDLWAHLGHVASAEDATRIVRAVIDLGWRPVVGSDPARLWSRGGAQ